MSYFSAHHADVQEKALLVELFYLNQQNSVAAIKEFRRMKQIGRRPMSPCVLRKMIQKFETTWHSSRTGTQRFVQLLQLSSLLEWWLTSLGHGTFCGVTKPTACSATGQRYRDMLRDFVIPQPQQRGGLQDIIFKQDSDPPHIDRREKQLLRQHFTEARVISRHFQTAWPPLSPDITSCEFWLWGYLKDNIYRRRPASLPDLKDSIRRHFLDIPADSLRSAVKNMVLQCALHR
ncbi:hypothetical protein AVEN_178497-1 [Araneus ventricosus]|uniref:DUF4817 domain-containing protein n=1 Tax=Araneus ventricosus TaxID=182803 RepID=A0A4Y2CFP7_ARAVE|nr:hypothetical protein AVEN_178497-1 [Araneus ventricosus]